MSTNEKEISESISINTDRLNETEGTEKRNKDSCEISNLKNQLSILQINLFKSFKEVLQETKKYIFPVSVIKEIYQVENAQELRRVFKSSLKYNAYNFAITVIYHNLFKVVLLEQFLCSPKLKIVIEFTIEPIFEKIRCSYFSLLNFTYANLINKSILKKGLTQQDSLRVYEGSSFSIGREIRSLALYVLSSLIVSILSFVNYPLAFLVEAYFAGYFFNDYKLSHAGIPIEDGIDISARNNIHYLGMGLAYKMISDIGDHFLNKFLKIPHSVFKNPLFQLFIYMAHSRDIPLMDPLKQYNCFYISDLPRSPSGDGIYVRVVRDKHEDGDIEGNFLAVDKDCDASCYYWIYLAKDGGWLLENEEIKKIIKIKREELSSEISNIFQTISGTEIRSELKNNKALSELVKNFPTSSREKIINEISNNMPLNNLPSSKKPVLIQKTFRNMELINKFIKKTFLDAKFVVNHEVFENFYLIIYPTQKIVDVLLEMLGNAAIFRFRKSKIANTDSKKDKINLLHLIENRKQQLFKSPITQKIYQFTMAHECAKLLSEFYQDDLMQLIKNIEDYKYIIMAVANAINVAGETTQNFEKIVERVFKAISEMETSFNNILFGKGIDVDTPLMLFNRFTTISETVKIPRWIIVRMFLNLLQVSTIVDSFKKMSDDMCSFFGIQTDVAIKVIFSAIKILYRYEVPNLLINLLSEDKISQLKEILKIDSDKCQKKLENNSRYNYFECIADLDEKIRKKLNIDFDLSSGAHAATSVFFKAIYAPAENVVQFKGNLNKYICENIQRFSIRPNGSSWTDLPQSMYDYFKSSLPSSDSFVGAVASLSGPVDLLSSEAPKVTGEEVSNKGIGTGIFHSFAINKRRKSASKIASQEVVIVNAEVTTSDNDNFKQIKLPHKKVQ